MNTTCEGCGQDFEAKRATAQYCSSTCRSRGNRKKPAAARAQAERYERAIATARAQRPACPGCNQSIPANRCGKYCSNKCRNKCRNNARVGRSYDYKRTLTCADCSKAIYKGKDSRPQGQARCQPCRRANPEPSQRAEYGQPCADCGVLAHGMRCRPCFIVYRKANALPHYRSGRKRYYMDKAAPGLNSHTQRRVLLHKWQRQGKGCAYCSGPAETVDHVIPLIRGGTNYEGNLVPCCLSCNVHKSHRLPIEWRLTKRVAAERVVVVIPPKAKPKVKPMRWAEQAFSICRQCSTLHDGKARCCSPECERDLNRVENRNKYRERVGIPVDAPLWSSLSPRRATFAQPA